MLRRGHITALRPCRVGLCAQTSYKRGQIVAGAVSLPATPSRRCRVRRRPAKPIAASVRGRVQCVQLARASQRHHQQQTAQGGAQHCRSYHPSAAQTTRAINLITIVLTIIRTITYPLFINAAAILAQKSTICRVAHPFIALQLI
ncbi:hypothetical protein BpHYR1_013867 [Brachionus plicatilis]|uniref:Uncharacterized protein n=1 Tax=Brachionus plicatilis TaxID=10195 RepID=A0A3M7SAA3_BRAPC|nr:hypothetical protein BpHYR1_013867 [Brachionus plicatilis]